MNLLLFLNCFCFMSSFFGLQTYGMLAPPPKIEPEMKLTTPALEEKVLTTGPPGKSLNVGFWMEKDVTENTHLFNAGYFVGGRRKRIHFFRVYFYNVSFISISILWFRNLKKSIKMENIRKCFFFYEKYFCFVKYLMIW